VVSYFLVIGVDGRDVGIPAPTILGRGRFVFRVGAGTFVWVCGSDNVSYIIGDRSSKLMQF
jgi:hypothetical protein